MSNRKLDFKTWCNDIGIRECDQTTKCDDCKAAWNFCQAQEKREYELLEAEHSELLADFCNVDIERIKLSREVEELKKTVSQQAKIIFNLENECSFTNKCPVNAKLTKENEALKKKLGEAVEVIKFYARKDLWKELEIREGQGWEKALIITSHQDQEVIGNTELIGGKKARAFLKGNKDE